MSRYENLFEGASAPHAQFQPASMLNIAAGGGQFGLGPDFSTWLGATPYVQQNMHILVLSAPGYFDKIAGGEQLVGIWKNLIETHCKQWEGFRAGIRHEYGEANFGGTAERLQVVTQATQDRTEPRCNVQDKEGRPIQNFLEFHLRMVQSPLNQTPGLAYLPGLQEVDLLPDRVTGSALAFELDRLQRNVTKAWLLVNFGPKGTGDIEGKRDLTAQLDMPELSLEWTALTQANTPGVKMLAQALWDQVSLAYADPYLQPAMEAGVDADVAAAPGGLIGGIDKAVATAVTRG